MVQRCFSDVQCGAVWFNMFEMLAANCYGAALCSGEEQDKVSTMQGPTMPVVSVWCSAGQYGEAWFQCGFSVVKRAFRVAQ